jgi:hypothetical protein
MEFAEVRIGTAEFLLTNSAHQRFVLPDGREIENTTTLANCREYAGESRVTYDTPEPQPSMRAAAAPDKPRAFAAGLRFRLSLVRPIDSATAAAGDSFEARLVAPLRDSRQRLVAPAASLVRGRILRVEAFHTKPREVVLVLRPEAVQAGDAIIALSAVPDFPVINRKKIAIELPEPGEESAGVFRFGGDRAVMPALSRSDWRTVR